MDKFNWGPSFIAINLDLLDAYAACTDSASVVAAQNAHIERCEAEQAAREAAGKGGDSDLMQTNTNRQGRRLDLPPTWSDEEEDGVEEEDSSSDEEDDDDDEESEEDGEDASSEEEAPQVMRLKKMRI